MAFLPLLILLFISIILTCSQGIEYEEITIDDIQTAFKNSSLTSHQLVEHYLDIIKEKNPQLHAVIEVNPDALTQADQADSERKSAKVPIKGMHGVPILLKDNIATKDKLNTTAGSFALLGSIVMHDAGVVQKLREAGAVILGKASLSEWSSFRSTKAPNGWSARGGQGKNPYNLSADPCGSSSGSSIAVAANMAAVSLGTETASCIICPASWNSVVGIKPTVGLTSPDGVIPISPRQDTVGPIARTMSDAVEVLEAIIGSDVMPAASQYIPQGGYKQFLIKTGLRNKRVGILRKGVFEFKMESIRNKTYEEHFDTMRKQGAILVDNLEIANINIINDFRASGQLTALLAEFKLSLNEYLAQLLDTPVTSLLDVIKFNKKHSEEKTDEIGQDLFLLAQNKNGIGPDEKKAIARMAQLSMDGLEKLMNEKKLDVFVTPDVSGGFILAIGGYPGITVPAGYDELATPFGLCFAGLKGSEPKLIETAFAFEQATKMRKRPPSLKMNEVNRTMVECL